MVTKDEVYKEFTKRIEVSERGLLHLHEVAKKFVDEHTGFKDLLETIPEPRTIEEHYWYSDFVTDYAMAVYNVGARLLELMPTVENLEE